MQVRFQPPLRLLRTTCAILLLTAVCAAHAERYIALPDAFLRENPNANSPRVPHYLHLFGMKNIGPVQVQDGWERFEYIEFPMGNRDHYSGWIESRYMLDQPPTAENMLAQWRRMDPSDRATRREFAARFIELWGRSDLVEGDQGRIGYAEAGRQIINEFRNLDAEIAAEMEKQKKLRVFLIKDGERQFLPLVLIDAKEFQEPATHEMVSKRESPRFLAAQISADQGKLREVIGELVFSETFLARGTKYALWSNGNRIGRAILNADAGLGCATCPGNFADADLVDMAGRPLELAEGEIAIAAVDGQIRGEGWLSRAPDPGQLKLLERTAKEYLRSKGVKANIAAKMKMYGARAFARENRPSGMIAASFGFDYPIKGVGVYGHPNRESRHLLVILAKGARGKFRPVSIQYERRSDEALLSEMTLVQRIDLDGDGKDELIVRLRGGMNDFFTFYSILAETGSGYRTLIHTGFSGVH